MHGIDFIQDLAVVMMVAGLVGWACHRAGLSVVVGYLAAGMVIGPYTPPFSLVLDTGRIETLAQVGLVFLMFSIGMRLSLRRLRRLGLGLAVAAFTGAIAMYNLARVAGGVLEFSGVETVFLAGMVMVSSSAIISKVLQEMGATHEKVGQMAMGVSVLEDVVAVVMLTVLGSIAQLSGPRPLEFWETLALLGAFVVLTGVVGLLLVPWLLGKLSLSAGEELPTIVMAGLLFVLAVLAQKAGFSLALGAFLLGAIVAETPQRVQVERTFEGLRDVFSAVFFVAVGMMIDVRALPANWALILMVAVLALLGRPLACGTGILLTGATPREALRVGLSVTPLGEFSFIIAQLGVAAGVVPRSFQVIAVGASLLTTLAAPVLTRRAAEISGWLETRQPKWFGDWVGYYHRWLDRLKERERQSRLWQLSKKRFLQIGVQMLLVTGLLAFSEQLFQLVMEQMDPGGAGRPLQGFPQALFWGGLTLVVLAPLVALWRNVSAMALLYAQVTTAGHPRAARLAPLTETGIKISAGFLLFLWLSAILPISGAARWLPLVSLAIVVVGLTLLRSRLIYWHSALEAELQERLVQAEQKFTGTTVPWLTPHSEWNLALAECVLPDLADCRGKTISELALRARFGCVVAGVERQGVMVGNPSGETALYPRDKVLLLGDPRHTATGKAFLLQVSVTAASSTFDEVRMETVLLPAGSKLAGATLAELAPTRRCGVQVAGINRGGLRILNPGGEEKLSAGDGVLVMGSPDQIAAFKAWVNEGVE